MTVKIYFCLALHNHQPVGNFDHVIEQAYQESYLPFLELFEPYQELSLSLHTSGPLLEWLSQRHPDYVERIARLVAAGRVEILGGAFYEPILTMIPSRDRVGQIARFTRWLEDRFATPIHGMWTPERVWEQTLVSDLARADISYTILDDVHFRAAGLTDEQLLGHFVSEDDGRIVHLFPGSETLRYTIPFRPVHETIDLLRQQAERRPGSVAVFGDDGEKFGTWPETHAHVYQDGWLREFFDALTREREWLKTVTLHDAYSMTNAVGRIYIPDCSYREMNEWSLPVERQLALEGTTREASSQPWWQAMRAFVRGGYWRNFKVKYPEANEMYTRMLYVSELVQQAEQEGLDPAWLDEARRELYCGQCNCAYWHGAFGGIYLPHLRHAIYAHLIAAERRIEQAFREDEPWVEATADDYNFDSEHEIRLANNHLVAWVDPRCGGRLYELDIRSVGLNVLATLARRPEAYHEKIRYQHGQGHGDVASIHDRVVVKQEGLDQRLQYDADLRKSLVDHFYDTDASPHAVARGEAMERGDFSQGEYAAKIRRGPNRVQSLLRREGNAWGIPITITKGVTLEADSHALEIAYLLEGVPRDEALHFAVELNFAGLPAGAEDRYFHRVDGQRLGHLGTPLDLEYVSDLCLLDQWLGIDVRWTANRPTHVWTFPVECVSQSEGGFEAVHQSVVLMPHWLIRGDVDGRWTVTMRMEFDTSIAEGRAIEDEAEARA
ncbi:MAG: DUF1926 domain-containing protein [Planctomycetales bacterium]|nr:DUF1926 domain-containing protein [Planctomycetales bacterium]MCA9153743.1 DUF1926 domain-containing protein [Planctomycetales bacterium]